MKIVLETLRFIFIFFILSTIFSGIYHLAFSETMSDAEKYSWCIFAVSFIFMLVLYGRMGWGKVFNKKILWASVTFIVLLTLIIPDVSPAQLHSGVYVYSYGFPFKFFTLHVEDGTKFVLTNLFSEGMTTWHADMWMFVNFILFYMCFHFISRNFSTKAFLNKEN